MLSAPALARKRPRREAKKTLDRQALECTLMTADAKRRPDSLMGEHRRTSSREFRHLVRQAPAGRVTPSSDAQTNSLRSIL
jgi:hypothetical protein